MSKTLQLQVCGGLGSRLRVMIGGLAYCQATGRKLIVSWAQSEPSETHAGGKFDCRLSDLYTGDFEEVGWNDHPWSGAKDARALGSQSAVVRYRTDKIEGFMRFLDVFDYMHAFDSMEMTDELRNMVNDVQFGTVRTIGVHIRFTLKAKECAPVTWYLDKLDEIDEALEGFKWQIFLSCDDRRIEDKMRVFWGDRLIVQERDYKYDRTGIMKQCADARIMQRCLWMLGSNHSSFSQHIAMTRGAIYKCDSNSGNHVQGGNYEDASVPRVPSIFGEVMEGLGAPDFAE